MTDCKQKYVLKINTKKAVTAVLCTVFIIISIGLSDNFSESIRKTLRDTVSQIIPALFPFMVISRFITNSGIISVFERTLGGVISRIFSVKKEASNAVFLGLLSGFPVGATSICDQYEMGKLSKKEAETYLGVAHNTGPAFPVSVIGTYLWNNTRFGFAIYLSQILSLFILSKLFSNNNSSKLTFVRQAETKMTISESLTNAISSSAIGCVNIIGFVVFWKTVVDAVLFLMPESTQILGYIAAVVLEFSSGAVYSASLGGAAGAMLTGFAVGFGGISALMQASYNTNKVGLSLKKCVLFKISQGFLCAVMSAVAFIILF